MASINLRMTNDNAEGAEQREVENAEEEERNRQETEEEGNYKSCKCHWVYEEIKFPSPFPLHISKH